MKLSETEYLSARNNTLELVTFIKFHPSSLPGEVGRGINPAEGCSSKNESSTPIRIISSITSESKQIGRRRHLIFQSGPTGGGIPKSTVPAETERTAVQVENVPRRDVTIYNVVC